MKKRYVIILLAICLGLLLTVSAIHLSTAQSQPTDQVRAAVPVDQEPGKHFITDCLKQSPQQQLQEQECRIRANLEAPGRYGTKQGEGLYSDLDQLNEYSQTPPIIEGDETQRNAIVNETGTIHQNPDLSSLSIYVENANGAPASYADVYVYSASGNNNVGQAQTGSDGYAYLDIPTGTYNIKVRSGSDHFFLYKTNVSAPGAITISAVGTPEVTLTAKKRDGNPLQNAYISIGSSNLGRWLSSDVGYIESNGTLVFHVLPGTYDIGINDNTAFYALYKVDQDFSNPTNTVVFDTTTDPTAEIIAGFPYDPQADLVLYPTSANITDFYYGGIPNGTHVVINANTYYYVYQWTRREDDAGNRWYLQLRTPHDHLYTPGEIFTFDAGGPLTVTGRTGDAEAGQYIQLTSTQSDSFGNYLGSIFMYTQNWVGSWINPQVDLTDPNGAVTHATSTSFYLPVTSPIGRYSMHLDWDSGPFQGVLTTNSQFNVVPFNGLAVYVETADGQPAVNARVYAHPYYSGYYYYTGSDGYAALDITPGVYNITAESSNDNFFLYQSNVSSPGVASLSAVGTPEISLTAKDTSGNPLQNAMVYVGVTNNWWASGYLGYVDPNGEITFHVTPNNYDIGVDDRNQYYALLKENQDFNTTNTVNFDMSTQPWATLVAGLPNDGQSTLYLCSAVNFDCFGSYYPNDGDQVVVSTGVGYYPYQYIQRADTQGNYWNYEFETDMNDFTYFTPGEVLTFTVGGALSASGRTQDTYVGDYVSLAEVQDSYGSYLTYIYTYTANYSNYETVYPNILLTDPNGSETYLGWLRYYFDVLAPTGVYDMHMEWNTGEPYQGMISADSQFTLLPQQTSAVIPVEGGTLYSTWDDTLYEFPPGTFTDTVIVTHTVRYIDIPSYAPLLGIGHFFDVTAVYSNTGLPAEPTQPFTVTIGYEDWQRGVVIEDSMGLYNWDGSEWTLEPTGVVEPINNHLVATPNHFSTWGILGETNRVFLAVIHKK